MIALTPDLLTNVPEIDEQHKELFNHLSATELIGTAPLTKEEIEETLEFLGAYVVKHFADEEKLMLESGYPKFDWHHTWHQGYIAECKKMKEEYATNGLSEQFADKLNESIVRWYIKHVRTVDVALGKHINNHRMLKNRLDPK